MRITWTLRRILALIGLFSSVVVFGTLVWLGATYQQFAVNALKDNDKRTVSFQVKQRLDEAYDEKIFPFVDNWSRFTSLVDAMTTRNSDKAASSANQIILSIEVVSSRVLLRNVVVYDQDMSIFAVSAKGHPESIASKPDALAALKERTLGEKRRTQSFLWRTPEGRPVHSTIAPIGGFRTLGFIEFVTDPIPEMTGIGAAFDGLFQLLDIDGNVLYQDIPPEGLPPEGARASRAVSQHPSLETLSVEIPGYDGEPWAVASITRDVGPFMNQIGKLRNEAMFIIGLAIVGSVVFGWLMLRLAVFNRLKDFAYSMKALARGQTDVTIPETGPDEFRIMRASLNQLRESVELRFKLQQKAESATAAKSKFLAAASHDLRQPLQAITLFVHALKLREQSNRDQDIINHIENGLEALNELLNALLDISKLDAGVIVTDKRDVSLAGLLGSITEEFLPLAREKGLELRCVSSNAVVYSDPILLKNIMRNLLSNAVRYTREGKILVGCRRTQGRLRIEVWDSGQGIDKEHRETIFEEFYQVGNPARDRRQGLGLGLSIVRRTADLLGHELTLRSHPGKGSVFAISVDLRAHSGKKTAPARHPAPHQVSDTTRTLMVIEDDPEILDATVLLLRSWGYSTVYAPSAEQALETIAADGARPDLVIVDYQLPGGLNGLDTYRAVIAKLSRYIPGIIVSGDTAPDDLDDIDESGLVYMTKPINPLHLQEHLRALLA